MHFDEYQYISYIILQKLIRINEICFPKIFREIVCVLVIIEEETFAHLLKKILLVSFSFSLLRYSFNLPDINGELQKAPRFECDCFLR